jgi:hypothetical protein
MTASTSVRSAKSCASSVYNGVGVKTGGENTAGSIFSFTLIEVVFISFSTLPVGISTSLLEKENMMPSTGRKSLKRVSVDTSRPKAWIEATCVNHADAQAISFLSIYRFRSEKSDGRTFRAIIDERPIDGQAVARGRRGFAHRPKHNAGIFIILPRAAVIALAEISVRLCRITYQFVKGPHLRQRRSAPNVLAFNVIASRYERSHCLDFFGSTDGFHVTPDDIVNSREWIVRRKQKKRTN